MHSYEIEIKVLLGTPETKDMFLSKVQSHFPSIFLEYSENQKNHYFDWGSLKEILTSFSPFLSESEKTSLQNIVDTAKSASLRTRETPTQTILVVKATVNDESSSNGTARIEWEKDFAPFNIDTLDQMILDSGFVYQAKWSRSRDAYKLDDQTVLCIDKNAGYGYVAEFERVLVDNSREDIAWSIASTRQELLDIIQKLGYEELNQDRLARMFAHYNANWSQYYGTDEVFTLQ